MTKSDLVFLIHEDLRNKKEFKKKSDITQKNILNVIDSLFDVLKVSIAKGEHIELRGLGTFEAKIRESKKKVKPMTKEIIQVPKRAVPVFRAGKELKQIVREYYETNNMKLKK